jgi:diguanylate cyclase (GGDEF)-like protein
MSRAGDATPRNSLRHAPELMIDLTNTGVVAEAAQLAVDELQSALGGGPWSIIVESTGEVLAASGPFGDVPGRAVPLPASGLDLVAVDQSELGIDDDRFRTTVERIGRLVAAVVDAEARAAEAVQRAARAEALATVDALTGLLDQGEWWRQVEGVEARLRRHPREVVVIVVDLDGLKATNDTKGHLHGDLVIRLAAETLSRAVRAGDVVARVGGDEFAVLAIDHESSARALVDRIEAAFADAAIPASIGASTHDPRRTMRETYAEADRAMYEQKRLRSGRLRPPDQP